MALIITQLWHRAMPFHPATQGAAAIFKMVARRRVPVPESSAYHRARWREPPGETVWVPAERHPKSLAIKHGHMI